MGESLAGFSGVLFSDMCRPQKRPTPRNELRDEVVARSAGRCVCCGELAQEVDHHIPRAVHGGDGLENLAAVCRACHKEKTCADHQRLGVEDANVFLSRFNDET